MNTPKKLSDPKDHFILTEVPFDLSALSETDFIVGNGSSSPKPMAMFKHLLTLAGGGREKAFRDRAKAIHLGNQRAFAAGDTNVGASYQKAEKQSAEELFGFTDERCRKFFYDLRDRVLNFQVIDEDQKEAEKERASEEQAAVQRLVAQEDQTSLADEVLWVHRNMENNAVTAADAPTAGAWSLLVHYRTPKERPSFYDKMLPKAFSFKEKLDEESGRDDFKDRKEDLAELEKEIAKAKEGRIGVYIPEGELMAMHDSAQERLKGKLNTNYDEYSFQSGYAEAIKFLVNRLPKTVFGNDEHATRVRRGPR